MRYFLLSLCFIMYLACTPEQNFGSDANRRYAHITDTTARAIIKASIEHAGGIERWEAIRHLQYTKDYSLLLESGEVERSYHQTHDYYWNPMVIDIQSTENGSLIHTTLKDGVYSRTIDGVPAENSQEELEKAVNTSVYVVSMPFKLLDAGAKISYEGTDTLNQTPVDIIRVAYDAEAHENHSTSDTWYYLFDQTDRKIVANWVKTGDHYSLVENLDQVRVNGILFNRHRKSFRTDSLRNKLYLRADYEYGHYLVE